MSRRLKHVIVMMGLWLGFSAAAYAQELSYELNVFGAGSAWTKKDFQIGFPQSITPVSGEFKLNSEVRYGFRLGVYTRGHWSEEFFYSFEPNHVHFSRNSVPPTAVSLPFQIHNYGISALYYLNDDESKTVRPFFSFGLGGTFYRMTPEARAFAHDPLRGNLLDMDSSNQIA